MLLNILFAREHYKIKIAEQMPGYWRYQEIRNVCLSGLEHER